jgi:putative MATE family efflux protein
VDDHGLTAEPRRGPGLDLEKPALRLVFQLAWPVWIYQLLGLAVEFCDRLLAGRYLELPAEEQLSAQAAQTTATYLAWMLTTYSVLVSVGSTALVARFTGARDHAAAVRATNQSILLAVLLGVAGSVIGLSVLPGLLDWMQMHGDSREYARQFMQPLISLLAFQVVEAAGIACLVGAGDTRTGLAVLGGVAALNVPLTMLFFFGAGPIPTLGFPGIALGTALAHTAGGLSVLGLLARGHSGLSLHWRLLRPDWSLLYRLLRVSVPAGADSFSRVGGQLWFLRIVNGLNTAAQGAHGIAIHLEALSYQSGEAFATATMTLVAQNLGASRPDRASRSGWTGFLAGGTVMAAMGAVFFVMARPLFTLFCPSPDQQPIVDAGVPVLQLVAFAQPALASCNVFTAALRGAGDTRMPLLITWLGFFLVRIPLAYVLTQSSVDLGLLGTFPGAGMGLFGAWLAMTADIFVRGAIFLLRFASGRWQRMRV